MCGTMANCMSVSNIDVPGGATRVGEDADVQEDYVTPAYFASLAMPIVAGRDFSDADTPGAPLVAIVNQAMAQHFFADVSPIGKRFKEGDEYEIIGVVADSHINGLREAPPRMVFFPYGQHPAVPFRSLYVRVSGEVTPALAGVRNAIRSVDRGIAVREVVTLGELERRSVARERLVSTLTSAFGLLAVAVACLGLSGMVSYSVARRTSEIGIRLALGATLGNVRWLVLRESIAVVTIGLAVGVALAIPALRFMDALVYGVAPRDPATLASAAATLACVGVLAGAVPAWRASRLNALIALRMET
jgi:predicted permease